MSYSYEYPHPAVTTDIVLFTVKSGKLQVLLIERGEKPFKNEWALPGGFLKMEEDLDACAVRELYEETGVKDVYLEQLGTFGAVGRDPRERVISVAYFALVPEDNITLRAGTDASKAEWFDIDDLPTLAFDHSDILERAMQRLAAKMDYSTIGLQFMGDEFTLTDVQTIYEIAAGKSLDKRNFRKWLLSLGLIEESGNMSKGGAFRPAKLYQVKDKSKVEILK